MQVGTDPVPEFSRNGGARGFRENSLLPVAYIAMPVQRREAAAEREAREVISRGIVAQ